MNGKIYPLRMEICRLAFSIDKVAIHPRLVNSIKLSLVSKQIGLSKRPSLGDRESIELVANLEKAVVLFLEPFVDFALTVFQLAGTLEKSGKASNLPLEDNFSPPPAALHQ